MQLPNDLLKHTLHDDIEMLVHVVKKISYYINVVVKHTLTHTHYIYIYGLSTLYLIHNGAHGGGGCRVTWRLDNTMWSELASGHCKSQVGETNLFGKLY